MPTARKPLALILALLVSLAIPQVAFAADPLAAGGSETVLHAQDSGGYTWRTDIQGDKFKDFESPDGLVGVYNITAGSVSYDANSRTLSLDGVTASCVAFRKSGSLTLSLSGRNAAYVSDDDRIYAGGSDGSLAFGENTGSVNVKGSGSLEGCVRLKGGLAVAGASVTADGNGAYRGSGFGAIECSKLAVTGGSLTAKGLDSIGYAGIICASASVSGGSLVATGSDGIECSGSFAVSRGTVAATGTDVRASSMNKAGISCASASISGGSIVAGGYQGILCTGSMTVSGGGVDARGIEDGYHAHGISCPNLTISGGSVSARGGSGMGHSISCESMTVKGGSITASGKKGIGSRNLYISGGSIEVPDADDGIEVGDYGSTEGHRLVMSGGTLRVSNPSNTGIKIISGELEMTDGTLAVTGSYGTGILVQSYTYRGATYGGKAIVSGGSLTSTTRDAANWAIHADSMSNRAASLASIFGTLPDGASLLADENEYKLAGGYSQEAILVKYGSKSTKPKLKSFEFGGNAYPIDAVASDAFNTEAGKKVKSLVLGNLGSLASRALSGMKALKTLKIGRVNQIGANAFYGTKSLTKLTISLPITAKYNKKGKLKSLKLEKGSMVAKAAFKKAGKSSGAKLTVTLDGGVPKEHAKTYGKFLAKRGLSKKAKLKIRK